MVLIALPFAISFTKPFYTLPLAANVSLAHSTVTTVSAGVFVHTSIKISRGVFTTGYFN